MQKNGREVFIGEGFESDESFKDWRFRRMKGRMEVEMRPAADSTDSTAVRPVRPSGGEQNAADDRPARRPDAVKPAPAPRPLPADSPASLPTRADLPASLPASAQEEPVRLDDPGIVPSRALKQGDSADGRLSE